MDFKALGIARAAVDELRQHSPTVCNRLNAALNVAEQRWLSGEPMTAACRPSLGDKSKVLNNKNMHDPRRPAREFAYNIVRAFLDTTFLALSSAERAQRSRERHRASELQVRQPPVVVARLIHTRPFLCSASIPCARARVQVITDHAPTPGPSMPDAPMPVTLMCGAPMRVAPMLGVPMPGVPMPGELQVRQPPGVVTRLVPSYMHR